MNEILGLRMLSVHNSHMYLRHDVLQETNMKLRRKCAEYDPDQPFLRWAYVFARFEVMAWRKRQQRSRLILDDGLLLTVATELEESAEEAEHRLKILKTASSG